MRRSTLGLRVDGKLDTTLATTRRNVWCDTEYGPCLSRAIMDYRARQWRCVFVLCGSDTWNYVHGLMICKYASRRRYPTCRSAAALDRLREISIS